ncbi:MAG: LPXTG cell wall anchor domain-containing protein [Saccharofermentanales bacterium]
MVYAGNRSISIPFIMANKSAESLTPSTDDPATKEHVKEVPTTGENPTIIFAAFAALALAGVLILIRQKYCAKQA